MDEQHPKFVVDSRIARKRLARAFELGGDGENKHRLSPLTDQTVVSVLNKNVYKRDRSISDLVRSIMSFVHQIWSPTSVKRSAKPNINGSGFLLLLVQLSESAATQTDNPVFRLLAGLTPLELL